MLNAYLSLATNDALKIHIQRTLEIDDSVVFEARNLKLDKLRSILILCTRILGLAFGLNWE